tara:strand:+ start:2479 stop:2661 length:183 start_codon:yes stop_codon:yes gene_type:complete
MQIQVEIVKEHEDGSADALVHFDKEGLAILVQYGILDMLNKAVKHYKTTIDTPVKKRGKK